MEKGQNYCAKTSRAWGNATNYQRKSYFCLNKVTFWGKTDVFLSFFLFQMPPRYDLRLHIAPDGFHIPFVGPFVLESGYNPKLEEETKWLCVKEKNETHCSD